ncbi:FliH/SctL family protein [Liquorilactobacillus sicerae]|uniref:FliH/SctL family protein n=1 Tax=Liquorilactobacillus sicerae TaxID=1416943 RepID=UPI00248070A1|nr:hypothetical protein [Liquorilactobacillus sicerae]
MKSLNNNVLKNSNVTETVDSKTIVTRRLPIKSKHNNADLIWLKDGNLNPQTNQLPKEKVDEFLEIQDKVIAQAKKVAEKLKQKGYDDGFAEGKKTGYQEGYQSGSYEGRKLTEKLTNQAKQNLQTALDTAEQYSLEKQTELIGFAMKMAEILIKKELDINPDTIKNILQPILLRIRQPDQMLIIKAHPRYHQQIEKQMKIEKEKLPNMRYLILDDFEYSAYQVTVETDTAILSFDLAKELTRFLKKNQMR